MANLLLELPLPSARAVGCETQVETHIAYGLQDPFVQARRGSFVLCRSEPAQLGELVQLIQPDDARAPMWAGMEREMAPTKTDARTVLVVEDYEDSLALLTSVLTRAGYNILTAGTGEEAIRMVVGGRPDLILMDLGLPGLSGLEVVWLIREQQELAEVPIIIISAHDSYDLREEATKAGCRGYLTKPLDLAEFKLLVKSILNEGTASP